MSCADINELSHYHTHPGKEENERQNVSSDPLRHPPETNSRPDTRADHCGDRIKRRARGDPLPGNESSHQFRTTVPYPQSITSVVVRGSNPLLHGKT
jgi:hypothetical protein